MKIFSTVKTEIENLAEKARGRAHQPADSTMPTATEQCACSARPKPAHFEMINSRASQVYVAGTFNNWRPNDTPLQKHEAGKWTLDLPLGVGRYEYRFVVDGQWQDDPTAAIHINNPFGQTNAVVTVPPSY